MIPVQESRNNSFIFFATSVIKIHCYISLLHFIVIMARYNQAEGYGM